jgi:hypothetical protein
MLMYAVGTSLRLPMLQSRRLAGLQPLNMLSACMNEERTCLCLGAFSPSGFRPRINLYLHVQIGMDAPPMIVARPERLHLATGHKHS